MSKKYRLAMLSAGALIAVVICLSGNVTFNKLQTYPRIASSRRLALDAIGGEGNSRFRKNVFYNRVGKCGSRSLLDVVLRLSTRNNFNFASSTDFHNKRPAFDERIKELEKVASLEIPTFYNRHIHFLDFERYGFERPIYINLIRDPIDRFTSLYNYIKFGDNRIANRTSGPAFRHDINECVMKNTGVCSEKASFIRTLQYFCGFDDVCATGSRSSVALAKKHIDEDYLFVGLTENFEICLELLEKILPGYFFGAVDDWRLHQEIRNATKTRRLDMLSAEARKKLRFSDMLYEYEVYDYAKSKFDKMKKQYGIL